MDVTRPITDRAEESLFAVLAPRVVQVLDRHPGWLAGGSTAPGLRAPPAGERTHGRVRFTFPVGMDDP